MITSITSANRVTTAACRLRLIERLMNGSLFRVRNLAAVGVRSIKFYVRKANGLRLVQYNTLSTNLQVPLSNVRTRTSAVAPLLVRIIMTNISVNDPEFTIFAKSSISSSNCNANTVRYQNDAFRGLSASCVVRVRSTMVCIVRDFTDRSLAVCRRRRNISARAVRVREDLLVRNVTRFRAQRLLNRRILSVNDVDCLSVVNNGRANCREDVLRHLQDSNYNGRRLVRNYDVQLGAGSVLLAFSLVHFRCRDLDLVTRGTRLRSRHSLLTMEGTRVSIFVDYCPALYVRGLSNNARREYTQVVRRPARSVSLNFNFRVRTRSTGS